MYKFERYRQLDLQISISPSGSRWIRKTAGLRNRKRFRGTLLRKSKSSPNLCVHSSSSYVSPSMLPLSSGDLIEWSLVCHSTLSYQKFCDRHSNHYDHPEELHQSVE